MINRITTVIGFIFLLGIMSAGGSLLLLRMLVDGLGHLIRAASNGLESAFDWLYSQIVTEDW